MFILLFFLAYSKYLKNDRVNFSHATNHRFLIYIYIYIARGKFEKDRFHDVKRSVWIINSGFLRTCCQFSTRFSDAVWYMTGQVSRAVICLTGVYQRGKIGSFEIKIWISTRGLIQYLCNIFISIFVVHIYKYSYPFLSNYCIFLSVILQIFSLL